MKYNLMIHTFIAALTICVSCSKEDSKEKEDTPPAPDATEASFVKGADISWVTEMESKGMRFSNAQGKETECTALMKELGFDAIRLRVWVDPADGYCNKEDVLAKALRAKKLGMKIMIDFHYSDTWADPSKQIPPAAWKDYDADKMAKAVGDHTKEVLGLLKDNGVEVSWVQVGNEVNQGMLLPLGQVKDSSVGSFAYFFSTGCNAVKSVYPDAQVILHVSNGHDAGLFRWFFSLMKSNNVRYDIIGMSLYPSWWENDGWSTGWKSVVDNCLANIRSLISTYGKPVMICETGMPCSKPEMSREAMQYILDETGKIDKFMGVFYWEPQAPDGYNDGYGLGAFTADGRPTAALEPFKN